MEIKMSHFASKYILIADIPIEGNQMGHENIEIKGFKYV